MSVNKMMTAQSATGLLLVFMLINNNLCQLAHAVPTAAGAAAAGTGGAGQAATTTTTTTTSTSASKVASSSAAAAGTTTTGSGAAAASTGAGAGSRSAGAATSATGAGAAGAAGSGAAAAGAMTANSGPLGQVHGLVGGAFNFASMPFNTLTSSLSSLGVPQIATAPFSAVSNLFQQAGTVYGR